MKNSIARNLLAILALAGLVACGGSESDSPPDEPSNSVDTEVVQSDLERDRDPSVEPADLATQVEGNNAFALDLYKSVLGDHQGEDLIASPYSVSIALAMTYAGARGQTEADMASVMHYRLPQEDLHPVFNKIDLELESRGENAEGSDGEPFQLNVANSIWGQDGFEFKEPFLDTLALNYGAGLRILDFGSDPEGSRDIINQWVEGETEGLIKDLLPMGSIRPSTRLVLTNAIYFNAAWALKFDENMTRDGDFTLLDSTTKSVPMMYQMETFSHTRVDDVDALELMYDGDEVSMVILMPEDFESFERDIDAEFLTEVSSGLESKMVDLSMPKFEIESTVPLTQTLKDMGMQSAFASADFTGMADAELVITDVLHKAVIKLDEAGTEAAAATAVVVGETSAPSADIELEINKPFIYYIRDVETNTIIFMGRVLDPS